MISSFPPDRCGVATYTRYLMDELAPRVGSATVIGYRGPTGAPRGGYTVERILRRRPTDGLRICASVRDRRPRILHLQSSQYLHSRGLLLGLLRLAREGYPVVTSAHEVPRPYRAFHMSAIQKLVLAASSAVTVHTQGMARFLADAYGIDEARIMVIPHGFPTPVERREDPLGQAPRLLFLGFIGRGKGLDVLLRALALLRRAMPEARLTIAGGQPIHRRRGPWHELQEELRSWVRALDLERCVDLLGYVPEEDLPRLFRDSQALVLPYRDSVQSGILHLGLAHGLPVVASAVGGLVEILVHRRNGLLVPPGNPRALADSLEEVLGDAVLRSHLARGALATARGNTWTAVAERTAQVYRVGLEGAP